MEAINPPDLPPRTDPISVYGGQPSIMTWQQLLLVKGVQTKYPTMSWQKCHQAVFR